MNEEEEEAPLKDMHVRRNCLAQDRHTAQSEEQHAVNANWRPTQKSAHIDA
jgi:hypothetical protein